MKDDMLQNFANRHSTPVFATKKADIIEGYRDKYGSNWKSQAAMDYSGSTDKKSTAYKSAIRHFQGDRLTRDSSKRSENKWEGLGQKLPPISRTPKGDSITVTVTGTQNSGRRSIDGRLTGETRERQITVTLTGTQAYDFVNNPDYSILYDEYGVDDGLFDDGDYELEVTGVS